MYKYYVKFFSGEQLFQFESTHLLSIGELLQSPETGERYKITHRVFMVDSTMTIQRQQVTTFTIFVIEN